MDYLFEAYCFDFNNQIFLSTCEKIVTIYY